MTHRTLLVCCVGILALSACGGGGDGGGGNSQPTVTGGGFAPTSGPGDAQSYYPLAAGNQWQMDFTTDDPNALASSALVTLTVTGTQQVLGAPAVVLNKADPTSASHGFDSYIGVSDGGITALGNTDPGDYLTPQLVPYVEQLFPVTPNTTVSTLNAKNLDATAAVGQPATLDMTQTIANAAIETVDVPAGTFTNALKQTTAINATAHANGQSAAITGTESSWFVPGVGEVKDADQSSGGGNTITTASELRFYVVNGTAHGLAPPKLLSSGSTGTLTPPGALPVATSDGTNFLIVMLQNTPGGAAGQVNYYGTLVDPYGNQQSFAISPPAQGPGVGPRALQAAAASDGTHYLVVYETDHAATGDPTSLDAVVLSATGAIVAGPTTVGTVTLAGFPYGSPGAEALAFDGSRYLLAYLSATGTLTGEFLDPATGQIDGATFNLVTDTALVESPALGFDGSNYLLAWGRAADTPTPAVRAERVSTAGTVLDAPALVVAQQAIPDGPAAPNCCAVTLPVVSFDGTNYLVSYWDYGTVSNAGTPEYAVVSSARVSRALGLLDASPIHVGMTPVTAPGRITAAFIDGAHWIAWTRTSADGIAASRVSPAGKVPTGWTDGFKLASSASGVQFPAAAASASGGYIGFMDGSFSNPLLYGIRVYPRGP